MTRLAEHTSPDSFPSCFNTSSNDDDDDDALLRKLLDEYHVLLRESEENSDGMCREALRLGDALVADIRAEADFPPDYLENVEQKVTALRGQLGAVERDSKKLHRRHEYLKAKRRFYDRLKAVESGVGEKVTERLEDEVRRLKREANEVTLLPGAVEDPGNRIKDDE